MVNDSSKSQQSDFSGWAGRADYFTISTNNPQNPPFPLYLKFPSLSPLFKIPLSPLFKIPPISSLFKASLFLLPLPPSLL